MTKLSRAARRNLAKDMNLPWNRVNTYWTDLSAKRAAERAAKLEKQEREDQERRMKEAGHFKPAPPPPSSPAPTSSTPGTRRRLGT